MTATAPGSRQRYENRTQEVSAISRGLKAIAKELNVSVIALSQLSRETERRMGDKRPFLSDLRDSGSIEQDADVVALIHRESYYNRDEKGQEDRGVFTSVPDLARKLRRYINAYAANAQPIHWKYSDPSYRIRSNELAATAH